MQDGPRFLTDLDINTAYVYTNLVAGEGGGATNSTNQTASGLTIDFTNLGQVGQTADGRFYRLCTIGGTSTVAPGTFLVGQGRSTSYAGLSIPTAQPTNTAFATETGGSGLSKGSVSFNVTNGSGAAITQDQFAGGYVEVIQTSGTSNGPIAFKLQGNTAAAESASCQLFLADALNVASELVAGTDTVNLIPCQWAAVTTSTSLAQPVGVLTVQAPNTSSSTYAAWVQVYGEALAQNDSTASAIAYEPIGQSTTVAGDVVKWTASTGGQPLGIALTAASASNPLPVFLTLN